MAAVRYPAFLAVILIFQAHPITANFQIPFLSPPSGNIDSCPDNVCGKGSCVVSSGSSTFGYAFGYACECESGWKQAHDNDSLKFLPCVVPNCTFDYSCGNAPAPDIQSKSNLSFLDPCFWSYCGGGSCKQTSVFTHTCECKEGYFNLFNSTVFPCYKECTLGLDCAGLGLGPINSTTSQPDSRPNTPNGSPGLGLSPINSTTPQPDSRPDTPNDSPGLGLSPINSTTPQPDSRPDTPNDSPGLGLSPINSTTLQPDSRTGTANDSTTLKFKLGWLITMANTLALVVWNYS